MFCVNEGLGYSSEEVHVWQRKRGKGKSDQPTVIHLIISDSILAPRAMISRYNMTMSLLIILEAC